MTRARRAFALSAFVVAGLATPLGGGMVERACAAGDVHVAVVVDIGSGSSASAVCVPGSSSDNGATILAARASLLGTPQPRYSASGLLCAIDGIPTTGCGVAHGGRYAYWSYWHGTAGKWSYSNIGPAATRVDAAIVEGWRWQPDGSGLPTDPAPRGPATATATCVPRPPPTAAPPITVVGVPTTRTTARPATVGVQQGGTTAPTTIRSSAPTALAGSSGSSTTSPASTGSPPSVGGHRAGKASGSSSTTTFAVTTGGIAAGPAPHTSDGVPVGLVVGVLAVAGLGAGGAVTARRRRRPAS